MERIGSRVGCLFLLVNEAEIERSKQNFHTAPGRRERAKANRPRAGAGRGHLNANYPFSSRFSGSGLNQALVPRSTSQTLTTLMITRCSWASFVRSPHYENNNS